MIKKYLQKLGMNEKEISIYLALVDLGSQPASVIAKKCHLDRVTTYKNAKKMVGKGFLKIYYQNGIQAFGIESFDNLKIAADEQVKHFQKLSEDFPTIKNLLRSIRSEEDIIPRLEIFEGKSGIKRFFRDLLFEVREQKLHQIRMLTSNTFEERLGDVTLATYINEFFSEIQTRNIDLEIYEASGNLIAEQLHKISTRDFNPNKLPATRGTTNIFIAGHAVYIACYRDSEIGLKIKQTQIAQIFHFLFDFMGQNT